MEGMVPGSGTVGTCLSQDGYEKTLKMATSTVKVECMGESSLASEIKMSIALIICMTLSYVLV